MWKCGKVDEKKNPSNCVLLFAGINAQNIIMIVLGVSVVVVTAIALIFYR